MRLTQEAIDTISKQRLTCRTLPFGSVPQIIVVLQPRALLADRPV